MRLAMMIPFWRGGVRRRGFTLVELAIVMMVVGLLMGASLIPMRALEERRQLRAEMQKMERVRDAIVGYAFRHRTRERVIKIIPWFGPRNEWSFRLPGGRPYLPCPDFDGDGFEDRVPEGRHGFMQGLEVNPNYSVVTATVGSFRGEKSMTWMDNDPVNYGVRPYGECRASRGTVPWRTLGVEPSDGWGNRHTYFADPVFSNAIFGFDRQTIADIYDSRVPTSPGFYEPAQRDYTRVSGLHVLNPRNLTAPPTRGFWGNQLDAGCPAAICAGVNCMPYYYNAAQSRTVRRCAWGMNAGNPVLKAGGMAESDIFPESSGGKYFPAGGVTDGLPFVLVSHGPNGRFAVNHWATLNDPIHTFTGSRAHNPPVKAPICNVQAWGTFDEFGRRVRLSVEERALLYEAINGVRVDPYATRCSYTPINDGRDDFIFNASSFVWQPPGISDKSDFDDLLLWMTRDELAVSIPGTIPKLPRMVIGYFPE